MSVACIPLPAPRINRSYHTSLKLKIKLGQLPPEVIKTFPRSNLHRWRNESFEDVEGAEYADMEQNIETVKELLQMPTLLKFVKRLIGLIRIKNSLIDYAQRGLLLGRVDSAMREIVVRVAKRTRDIFPLEKILGYFNVSVAAYYQWKRRIETDCLETVTGLCPRQHPGQLTKSEIKSMSDMLQDPRYEGWPIYAIAHEARKKGILAAHHSTWHKHAKLLEIQRKQPKSRRRYAVGLRASKPFQYLHLDVTKFRLADNTMANIHLIIDNFSRFILGWFVSFRCCGEDCRQNLSAVYHKHILPALQGSAETVTLISDGGSENRIIREFTLANKEVDLQWLIAQSDELIYSNSMIEAVNKSLKYRSLYLHDIPNFEASSGRIETSVQDYNNRPHSKLNGLTPQEVLNGVRFDKEAYTKQMKESQKRRIEENRLVRCANCDETMLPETGIKEVIPKTEPV